MFLRIFAIVAALAFANYTSDSALAEDKSPQPKYVTQSLRGQVVWVSEALKRRFNIVTEPQATESMVALETAQGELHPIVLDVRGRAFVVDERLRNVDVELFVRRYEGSPMIQVIRVFAIKSDGKYELDYWCDICAITMYILKDCECCQGATRLRERKAEETAAK